MTILPALVAGIFGCGAGSALPRGTTICGTEVGGLTRAAAVEAVREDIARDLKAHCLTVYAEGGQYSFRFPQLAFADNVREVVQGIRRAGGYDVEISYRMNGLDEVISGIYAAQFRQMREPQAYFCGGDGEPFIYEEGQDGIQPDADKLREDILSSLSSRRYGEDFAPVHLSLPENIAVKNEDMAASLAILSQRLAEILNNEK